VDAANDLALLKAVGRFAPLPIAASRTVKLGGTVATVGFPDIGLQGFAPKVLAHGHHGGNRVAGVKGSVPSIEQILTKPLRATVAAVLFLAPKSPFPKAGQSAILLP